MKPTKSVKRMLTGSIGALIVTLGTIAPVAADHDDGRVRVAYQPAVDCVGDDRFGRGHTDCVGFYHGTHDHPSNAYSRAVAAIGTGAAGGMRTGLAITMARQIPSRTAILGRHRCITQADILAA